MVPEDATPWEEWLGPLLTSAIAAAPLDLADSWALALRFGVNGLGEATGDGAARGLAELMRIIATPTAPGARTDHCGDVYVNCGGLCENLQSANQYEQSTPNIVQSVAMQIRHDACALCHIFSGLPSENYIRVSCGT